MPTNYFTRFLIQLICRFLSRFNVSGRQARFVRMKHGHCVSNNPIAVSSGDLRVPVLGLPQPIYFPRSVFILLESYNVMAFVIHPLVT
jgi:hypothetical protein